MAKLKVVHKWVGLGRVQSFMLILGGVGLGRFTCAWVGLGRVKKTGPASNSGCTVPSPLIFQFNHWICVLLSIIMEQLDISE